MCKQINSQQLSAPQRSIAMQSALEVCYENVLYKFTFDIKIAKALK